MILHLKSWSFKKQIMVFLIGLLVQLPFQSIRADIGIQRKYDLNQGNTSQQGFGTSSPFVPGDAIIISTFPDTTSFLNQTFPITDRGFVELPIYGKVRITDMTKTELENFIKEQFRDYLRFPYLNVKPLIRVSVLGGIPNPGFYYFDPEFSLWQLIYKVGGANYEEGLKKMKWERNRKIVADDLIPFLQRGTSLLNMGFRSGDQIWVESPGKPTFIEKARNYFGIATFVAGIFTFYYTYRLFLEGRTTRINVGNSRLQ